MPRDLLAYAWDAAEAIRLLTAFTQGKTFEDYRGDPLLRSRPQP